MEKLGIDNVAYTQRQVVCINQDSFYRELSPDEKVKAAKGNFNFDHPGTHTSTYVIFLERLFMSKKFAYQMREVRRRLIFFKQSVPAVFFDYEWIWFVDLRATMYSAGVLWQRGLLTKIIFRTYLFIGYLK